MEQLMDRMQDENTGIPVRTVNKFRAKVPSVFTGKFLTHSCYFTLQPIVIIRYGLFKGTDLILWIMKNVDVDDQGKNLVGYIIGNANKCNKILQIILYSCILVEALYFANLLSSHGYLFPIDDHFLNVKNDGSYYRFQVSHL